MAKGKCEICGNIKNIASFWNENESEVQLCCDDCYAGQKETLIKELIDALDLMIECGKACGVDGAYPDSFERAVELIYKAERLGYATT